MKGKASHGRGAQFLLASTLFDEKNLNIYTLKYFLIQEISFFTFKIF